MNLSEEPDIGNYEEYVLSGIEDQASEEVAQRYEEIEKYHTEQIDRDCCNKQFRKCVMYQGVCINCKKCRDPKMFKPHYPKDDNEQEDFDTGDHWVRVNGKYYTYYEKDMMDIKDELQELQLELGAMGIANHDKRVLAISDRIFDIIKKYEKPDPDGEIA